MSAYDVIVIGGGVNGLTAAAILARRGKSVCLIEAQEHLGGMAAGRPDGSTYLAHALYNLSPAVRRDLGFDDFHWPFEHEVVPTIALDAGGNHVLINGASVTSMDGYDHPDAEAFNNLRQQIGRYAKLLRQLAEAPPPGSGQNATVFARLRKAVYLARFGIGVKGLGKVEMRRFLQVLLSNTYDFVLDELPDGPLAGLLAADAVRGAAAGPRSPGTVFNLIYRYGYGGTVSFPKGGMNSVIDAFRMAATQSKSDLVFGQKVTRILVDQDRVCGVETSNGQRFAAPFVLATSGPKQAAHLCGVEHFDIENTRRIRCVRARGTTAKVNVDLKSVPKVKGSGEGTVNARYVYAPSAEYVERAFNPSKYKAISEAPVIEFIFPHFSNPDHPKALSALVQYAPVDLAGGWTEEARQKLQTVTLDTLSTVMHDLRSHVDRVELVTPDQIEEELGTPGGHWHHAELSLDQILTLRPGNGMGHYAFGPKGLYLCGASSHPGGDIMGLAGRNAAKAVHEAKL